ncbi:MAG: hypothetical protein KGH57_01175 [Candidatus Micrarchaeota archaeon]|nr:hypothetical protein [Candidatus Micrarchaeota archaeon]
MVSQQINVKAAAIAGAVLGFLWFLFSTPYGVMGGLGYYGMMGYMMGYAYSGFGFVSVVLGAIIGAVAGAVVAIVYNWAAKLK